MADSNTIRVLKKALAKEADRIAQLELMRQLKAARASREALEKELAAESQTTFSAMTARGGIQ